MIISNATSLKIYLEKLVNFKIILFTFLVFGYSINDGIGQINLVKVINNGDGSSFPHDFVRNGKKIYFNISNPSDAVGVMNIETNDTQIIKSIGYHYQEVISSHNNIYFRGIDSVGFKKCLFKLENDSLILIAQNLHFDNFKVYSLGNKELLIDNFSIYDISGNSMQLLDSNIFLSSFREFRPFVFKGKLFYFSIISGIANLWETNGEVNGVRLVETFQNYKLIFYQNEENLASINNENYAYFFINSVSPDNENNYELNLYKIENGQVLKVKKIKDQNRFDEQISINNLNIIEDIICFGINKKEIWSSNGNPEQTILKYLIEGELPLQYNKKFMVLNNEFYYFTKINTNFKIFKTNGIQDSPTLVINLGDYEPATFPFFMQKGNGLIYFNKNKKEIWSTNGLITQKLTDIIYPFTGLTVIVDFGQIYPIDDDKILFCNYTNREGAELWKAQYDFTLKNMLGNLNTIKRIGISANKTIKFKNKYFFESYSEFGNEIFYTDGTSSGTDLLIDLNPNFLGIEVKQFVATTNFLYFLCRFDNESSDRIFVTDGTKENTKLITYEQNINPFVNCETIAAIGDELFFGGYFSGYYKYNPFLNQSIKIDTETKIINKVTKSISFDSGILFLASSFYFYNKEDGTIKRVFDNINNFPYNQFAYSNFYLVNNKVLFFASFFKKSESAFKDGIFITDGTQNGTKLIKEFKNAEIINNKFLMFYNFNDKFYFRTYYDDIIGKHKLKFWVTDATEQGTKFIDSLVFDNYLSELGFTKSKQEIFLISSETESNKRVNRLYLLNSNQLKFFHQNHAPFPAMSNAIKINNTYYMGFDSTNSNLDLWTTDGFSNGTHFLAKINNDNFGSKISNILEFEGKLVFFGLLTSGNKNLYSYNLPTCNNSLNYTIRSGDWKSKYVWSCGEKPTLNQNVVIKKGHKISTDGEEFISVSNLLTENGSVLLIKGNNYFISNPK
jgi:ELWxxDGT repeat protein